MVNISVISFTKVSPLEIQLSRHIK